MRTVLCTTAGRQALLLTLVVGTAGLVALPAAANDSSAPQHKRSEHAPASTTAPSEGDADGADGANGAAVLGPAVKFVRDADGTVRQVR